MTQKNTSSEIPTILEAYQQGAVIVSISNEGWFCNVGDLAVGNAKISRIVPYQEDGDMARITWFAIFVRNGKQGQEWLYERIDSKGLLVRYDMPYEYEDERMRF